MGAFFRRLGAVASYFLESLRLETLGAFSYHYHKLHFSALSLWYAPEAGLWPLLIVLLSGLLPEKRIRRGHILGFLGAGLIILGVDARFYTAHFLGYALALACALT